MEAIHTMAAVRSRDKLSVRLLKGQSGLEEIRPVWEELAAHVDSMSFHHQYAWYQNYFLHLDRESRGMQFVVVSRGEESVAILPLSYRKPRRFGGPRVIQLPSHDHFCAADMLVRRGENHAEIMSHVIRQLRRKGTPGWDVLLFPQVCEGSCVDRGLRGASGLLVVREMARGSDYIPNAGGYEKTMQRLSGSFKRDLRRKRKHAESQGALIYRSVESPAQLREAFEAFLKVEGSGWKGRHGAGTAIECNPEAERFYRGLLSARSPVSRCVINLLDLNGTCIAAEFCLYCNGVLSLLKIGYLESHARISPGSLLLDCVLRDWCERPGVGKVSLVGDAAWQRTWHPEERPVFRYRVYNTGVRALPDRLWRSVKPLLVRIRDGLRFISSMRHRSTSRH